MTSRLLNFSRTLKKGYGSRSRFSRFFSVMQPTHSARTFSGLLPIRNVSSLFHGLSTRYQKYCTYTTDDSETDKEDEVVIRKGKYVLSVDESTGEGSRTNSEDAEPVRVYYCEKETKGLLNWDSSLIKVYEQFYDKENEEYTVVTSYVTARQHLGNYLNDSGVQDKLYTRYTNFDRISSVFQSWLRQALVVSYHSSTLGVIFRPTLENTYVVLAADKTPNIKFNAVLDGLNETFSEDDEVQKDHVVYYVMRFAEEISSVLGIKPTFNITHLRLRAEKGDKWWVDIQDLLENPLFWSIREEQGFIIELGTYMRKPIKPEAIINPNMIPREKFRLDLYDNLKNLTHPGFPNLTEKPWFPDMEKDDFGTDFECRSDLIVFASHILSHEDKEGSQDEIKKHKIDKIKANWDNDPALLPTCLNEKFGLLQAAFFMSRESLRFSWRLPICWEAKYIASIEADLDVAEAYVIEKMEVQDATKDVFVRLKDRVKVEILNEAKLSAGKRNINNHLNRVSVAIDKAKTEVMVNVKDDTMILVEVAFDELKQAVKAKIVAEFDRQMEIDQEDPK